MTDVAPARGRSSARGRGGYASRGGRAGSRQANGTPKFEEEFEDQGEIGELKKQFSSQLATLKELFPDWTDVDLVFALQETNGDLPTTIERITEGHVSKFADVPKAKDRSRSKAGKDHSTTTSDQPGASNRQGRGRGSYEGSRGGRGRGTERGRGGYRGGRGGTGTNGVRSAGGAASVPTKEADGWNVNDGPAVTGATEGDAPTDGAAESQLGGPATSSAQPAAPPETQKAPVSQDSGTKKGGWASLFAKPKPAPAPPKPAAAQAPPPAVPVPSAPEPSSVPEPEQLPTPPAELVPDTIPVVPDVSVEPPPLQNADDGSIQLPPSKDRLTEDNVEHLPDSSRPPPTETAASTVASSVATPLTQPHAPIGRPGLGGFATSALKATSGGVRSASFQRKILEQQEAVVMPGNHAVDRAAVQFGSMGLNGDAEPDVDDDREEAETRAQPPQHSPVQQPRASLPPIPRQPSAPAEATAEGLPSNKQNIGLPPAPQQQAQQQQPAHQSPAGLPSQAAQQSAQGGQPYNQFGLRGNHAGQSDPSATQKPYDPFGAQVPQQPSQFDGYPSNSQASSQQANTQTHLGGFSQQDPYSSYYSSEQNRNAYQNYYGGNYNQQSSSQQQAGEAQQRTGSGFGAAPGGESGYPSSQTSQQQGQSRYGAEAHNSGTNTPNPPVGAGQNQSGQSQQSQHPQQQHLHGQGQHGAFPNYQGHPYAAYNQYGYGNYMNQYPYGTQGFGGSYGGKGGMYGHNHPGYGMSPQSSYDQHSSSPANAGGFSQRGHDSNLSGLSEYGRSGSAQPSQSQQQNASNTPFGSFPDSFGRSQSGYPGQGQYGQSNQQSTNDDSLKPFSEGKTAAGASPSSLAAQGRPGSATNTTSGQGQNQQQSHQQGFGGYPSHLGGQYGGLGGLGAQQSHQAGGYGGFSGGYGAGSYSYNQRGGWGGNYGGH